MAEVRVIHEQISRGALRVYWVLPLNATNTTAQVANAPQYQQKSVTVTGTFDGATITMQGSIDGVNFVALHDSQGNNLAFTTAGIKDMLENPYFFKPVLSGGSGSQSLTVNVNCIANHAG